MADISKDIGTSGAEKIIAFLIDNGSLVLIEDGFVLHAHLLDEAEPHLELGINLRSAEDILMQPEVR